MWHLKTKLGTFWIVSEEESHDKAPGTANRYYLGMDDATIRAYDALQDAVKDVYNHTTGELHWDVDTHIKVPEEITSWQEGEPEVWQKN